MKKLTAVELLFEKLWETNKDKFTWHTILKEAKQIEKEQIIEAFDVACEDEDRIGSEYYNDTFKHKKL